ncbi:MAG: 50S ribosomal protein L29 [Dehalococcoidales bacterium]|nr:50S ribosomal protein L29 [Dehalococcoidales bacterium]
MKIEEIRALSAEELAKQLEAAHQELFDLRFRLATKQLVNHRQVRVTKKTIARLQTIIQESSTNIR